MSFFANQRSLFRAYDIRGDEQYFTPDFLHALSVAFVRLYQRSSAAAKAMATSHCMGDTDCKIPTVIVGYDVRRGSDDIAQMLATILQQQGLQVINLGLITTPMMAFWTEQYDGHGIMVTASHSAKGVLGIKWLVNNTSPSAQDIQTLYQDLSPALTTVAPSHNQHGIDPSITLTAYEQTIDNDLGSELSVISLPTDTVATPYIQAIAEVLTTLYPKQNLFSTPKHPAKKLNLTIVIDCMHGATSRIAKPLFNRFCQQVIILNDTPDGSFPMGNPDPTEPNRLAELQQTVIVHEADVGLAFDGDGDRLMVVDNLGKVINPDHLLYLLAKVAVTERLKPLDDALFDAPKVLFDVKCSHHLPILLSAMGATPVISKTGSSLMRQQLQCLDSHIVFAGELSGHFIFNDGYFTAHDDAMYAGLRLLHWLAYTATIPNDRPTATFNAWGESIDQPRYYRLTDMTQRLPTLISTSDHYLPLAETTDKHSDIIKELAEFCAHLQHAVHASLDNNDDMLLELINVSSCDCALNTPPFTVLQAKQLLPLGTRLTCIDGVRLDFSHSFGVLRQSNTSHSLTVRFAGDSIEDLQQVQARFVALCRPFDANLAKQIAAIIPV